MIGRTLLHYEVLAKIGSGGMGDVYLAADKKLKRNVALKVLPAEVATSPERLSRFQREAEAVAALNHPNIVTLFSVEESAGVHFLTMEHVDGVPLAELLTKGGLAAGRLLDVALELTSALTAAHARGITHRDLKPQNVMLTRDGRVKVLDFGLAKITRPSDRPPGVALETDAPTETHTLQGTIVGSTPYMSPEQIAGREVDPRSDIFSLGIVLFEMATGHRPFRGDTAIELLSAILKETAPAIGSLRPDLPEGFERAVERCLEKDPEDRFQDAADLRKALRAAAAAPPETRRPRGKRKKKERDRFAEGAWTAFGGAVTIAAGIGLSIYLFILEPGQPTWLVSIIPLLVGITLVVYGRWLARGSKTD